MEAEKKKINGSMIDAIIETQSGEMCPSVRVCVLLILLLNRFTFFLPSHMWF